MAGHARPPLEIDQNVVKLPFIVEAWGLPVCPICGNAAWTMDERESIKVIVKP